MKKIIAFLLSFTILCTCIPALADSYSDMLEKANSFLDSQDYSKAIASFQLAQKLQPQNELAFIGEANIHIMLKDYSAASDVISIALESNPVSPDAWKDKCLIDILTNDIAAFEQDIVFAEICEADLPSLYLPAALMYTTAGLYDKAASYFKLCDFSSLNPEHLLFYQKALVYSGNREEAEHLGLIAAEVRNDKLDSAYENNRLILAPKAFPLVTAEAFEFSDEMMETVGIDKNRDPITEIASALPDSKINWLSLSPAGNSGILQIGEATIAYYNEKYRMIYPSSSVVDDTNGNLAKVFSTPIQQLLSDAGVVYSPDGRYAAICNINYTRIKMLMILDPIIIDLSTGEMILTATYGNHLLSDEIVGAVTTATFSSDNHYFYYMLYGSIEEYHTALYRFNLNTQQTEFCYSGSNLNYYPRISETRDGSFIIIRDELDNKQPQGLTSITCYNRSWTGKDELFDLPMKYWYTNRLLLSDNSGYALLFGKSQLIDDSYYSFQLVSPADNLTGLNQYHALSKSGDEILTFTANEIVSLFDNISSNATDDEKTKFKFNLPFQEILASAISPDGHYVLLLSMNNGTEESSASSRHLYLVKLDDLSIKEVAGLEPSNIMAGKLGANYAPVIEWNTDILIIGTSGGIQAYQFEME